ncbi:protein of unknown function [Amycolatopsis arida]|uniref:Four-helix bundle copper-binding protein n=1 Tax=Amycolatopsis arida TaxID=587909 RepID=A0A1I5YVK6_9PSEU|nr:four-helix bundle copper-binding protein [Amycolatopsis arida]TDX89920.1 uncharacterized protein DUF326 [Amycolatopsis arida]SFQ48259.1 protein of unknown function [Amycolatopsis arida]
MTRALRMLETHPAELGGVDPAAIVACIEECLSCAQACTACADACLGDANPERLIGCVRANLDCADVCETTARVVSRRSGSPDLTAALLAACEQACRGCAAECERHGGDHPHCAVCAEACRTCEDACQQLREHLGTTGRAPA